MTEMNQQKSGEGQIAAIPRRWKVSRAAWFERWRFGLRLRVYHGFGLPKFEFEFRVGFPRPRANSTDFLALEDADAI